MKRKVYQTPTMQVVKLQHQSHLMVGSERTRENLRDYDWNEYEDE